MHVKPVRFRRLLCSILSLLAATTERPAVRIVIVVSLVLDWACDNAAAKQISFAGVNAAGASSLAATSLARVLCHVAASSLARWGAGRVHLVAWGALITGGSVVRRLATASATADEITPNVSRVIVAVGLAGAGDGLAARVPCVQSSALLAPKAGVTW